MAFGFEPYRHQSTAATFDTNNIPSNPTLSTRKVIKMKIKVIGAGWYGSYVAYSLIQDGHEVQLFERRSELFGEASGANQSRLHLGFHYPRDAKTRVDAIEGYNEFMATFPFLTQAVHKNIYAIAEDKSLIDWQTYHDTIKASGVDFLSIDPADYGLANCEGAMLTGERLILQANARDMWRRLLSGHVNLNSPCDLSDAGEWDYVINCTYGAVDTPGVGRFEPCVIFLYEGRTDTAVTIMDGPHGASIYPWFEHGLTSLTSVRQVRLAECQSFAEAEAVINATKGEDLNRVRAESEANIREYVPWFNDEWKYAGHSITTRALPGSVADRRVSNITKRGNVISVLPGKISGIFKAARDIKELIAED